ncbi:MAG: hypothetical protein GY790_16710 [Bacteroidetes bacterium]|nr:hypothetical protein [Bacteroidota bacterium]
MNQKIKEIIGGLISAIVISTLGISKSGGAPTGLVQELSKDFGSTLMTIITIVYVVVWFILGCFLVYYGVYKFPAASSTINELGQAWLGLAIGAAYAYFGFNTKKD